MPLPAIIPNADRLSIGGRLRAEPIVRQYCFARHKPTMFQSPFRNMSALSSLLPLSRRRVQDVICPVAYFTSEKRGIICGVHKRWFASHEKYFLGNLYRSSFIGSWFRPGSRKEPCAHSGKTALALGHSDPNLIFRHYRELVSAKEALAFWNLVPPTKEQSAKLVAFT